MLGSIKEKLVTAKLVETFTSDYVKEFNRLNAAHIADQSNQDRRLAETNRKLKSMMDAIEAGIITPTTKARLLELEDEKEKLASLVAQPVMPVIHPHLASRYRRKVEELEALLTDPATSHEAMNAIRSLIDRIEINPCDKRGEVEMQVFGELAVLLGVKDSLQGVRFSVVTGAGLNQDPTICIAA